MAEKRKTNPDSENKITNYKRKCKCKKKKKNGKHNNNSENIIKSQIYIMYYVYIVRKHNDKFENTRTNLKTKQQFWKHNDNSDKPEKVGIVWGSAKWISIDNKGL